MTLTQRAKKAAEQAKSDDIAGAVEGALREEITELIEDLERQADAKEKMYRELGMVVSGEREAKALRDVALHLRKRLEGWP